MPASYVKPHVKRDKTDAADAEVICEAVTRPAMRLVPIKSAEQQAVLMLHRMRELLVRQRTMLVNALRRHMAELGIIVPQRIARVADLLAVLMDWPWKPLASGFLPVLMKHVPEDRLPAVLVDIRAAARRMQEEDDSLMMYIARYSARLWDG